MSNACQIGWLAHLHKTAHAHFGASVYIYADARSDRHSCSGVDLGWSVLVGNGENCARKDFHLATTLGSSPEPSSEVVRANFQVEDRVL